MHRLVQGLLVACGIAALQLGGSLPNANADWQYKETVIIGVSDPINDDYSTLTALAGSVSGSSAVSSSAISGAGSFDWEAAGGVTARATYEYTTYGPPSGSFGVAVAGSFSGSAAGSYAGNASFYTFSECDVTVGGSFASRAAQKGMDPDEDFNGYPTGGVSPSVTVNTNYEFSASFDYSISVECYAFVWVSGTGSSSSASSASASAALGAITQ